MRKLTPNQQRYQKEIKRIRRNLSKLRNEGYDVSELAKKYSTTTPKRVTEKMLRDLHNITPKKIRAELQESGAYHSTVYQARKGSKLTTPFSDWEYKPEYEYLQRQRIEEQFDIDKDELYTLTRPKTDEEFITEETTPDTPPETPTEDEVRFTEQVIDEGQGKVFTVDTDTGEIIDEADLYIEELEDGTILYINGDTGEIVGKSSIYQNNTYEKPDMTSYTIDWLKYLGTYFGDKFRTYFDSQIDKMIQEVGTQAVADAYNQVMANHPNIMERFLDATEKYEAAIEILGEMAEILSLTPQQRDEVRDDMTSNSMSDMELYLSENESIHSFDNRIIH